MKMQKLNIFFLGMYTLLSLSLSAQKKVPRAKGYWGLHLDFHVRATDKNIGEFVTDSAIENLIKKTKPDYIQIDSKGHPGFSSYPTKVGVPAPGGFAKDQLKIWRSVTDRMGVTLLVHHSGVQDVQAVKEHPEWAQINAKGEIDKKNTSTRGNYVYQRLIPQLKELAGIYKMDGVWLDGECWAIAPDYHPEMMKAFQQQTGITQIPYSLSDSNYKKYLEFNRFSFKNYISTYSREIKKDYPEFAVISNWAFSSRMPEEVSVNVDVLSGDVIPDGSISNAAFEGRCMASQGKPWDLESWALAVDWQDSSNFIRNERSALQIKQDAAQTLSLGGGFMVYLPQNRDGSIPKFQVPMLQEIAMFCREREKFCHNAKMVPQVALLYSTAGFKHQTESVYGPYAEMNKLKTMLNMLLNKQYSVEILMEHHLKERMQEYPTIIIPEWRYLEEEFKMKLVDYVNKGGNLMIIGAASAKLFEKELGVSFTGDPKFMKNYFEFNHKLVGVRGNYQFFKAVDESVKFVTPLIGSPELGIRDTLGYLGTIRKVGKGKVAAIYADVADYLINNQSTVWGDYFKSEFLDQLFPKPMVEVKGSDYVQLTVTTKNKALYINLMNVTGPHLNKTSVVYDDIPVLRNLKVLIRYPKQPSQVKLQPGNMSIPYNYKNGQLTLTLKELAVHSILEIK